MTSRSNLGLCCLPPLAGWRRGFGPCSAAALVREFPFLVNRSTARHPLKVLLLLHRSDAQAVRSLCRAVPRAVLDEAFPRILAEVSCECVAKVLAPLVSSQDLGPALAALLGALDAHSLALVANSVPAHKLTIVLKEAPTEKLTALITCVNGGRIELVLIPVLQEPEQLLQGTLVPLLSQVEQPERVAAVVNHAEPEVLLRLLRELDAARLVALVNVLDREDFEPEGSAISLLQALADERGLMRDKAIPLLQCSEPSIIAQLVQGVKAQQLLDILRRVEVDGVVLLLEHTNIDLVVRLFNGPLETAIGAVAGNLAEALKGNPLAANAVKELTNMMNEGLVDAEKAVDAMRGNFQETLRRGKKQREEEGDEGGGAGYVFGDLTRGLMAEAMDKGKVMADNLMRDLEQTSQRIKDQADSLALADVELEREPRAPDGPQPAPWSLKASSIGAGVPGEGAGRRVPMCDALDVTLADLRPSAATLASTIGRGTEALAGAWDRGANYVLLQAQGSAPPLSGSLEDLGQESPARGACCEREAVRCCEAPAGGARLPRGLGLEDEDASQLLASPPRANSARSDPALADEQSPPPELPFLSEAHQRQLREAVDRGKEQLSEAVANSREALKRLPVPAAPSKEALADAVDRGKQALLVGMTAADTVAQGWREAAEKNNIACAMPMSLYRAGDVETEAVFHGGAKEFQEAGRAAGSGRLSLPAAAAAEGPAVPAKGVLKVSLPAAPAAVAAAAAPPAAPARPATQGGPAESPGPEPPRGPSLDERFAAAQAAIKAISSLSNNDKLRAYAAFKQATVGPAGGSRPSAFDMVGRAKYDAWASLKDMSAEEAKRRYCALADECG